jgi:hypothetical protein
MNNPINVVETAVNPEGIEVTEELAVPESGTQIVFGEGKFRKSFSVQPLTKPGIAAAITTHGLGGFSVRLFKSVPKHIGPDGSLVFYDPLSPMKGRVILKISGE